MLREYVFFFLEFDTTIVAILSRKLSIIISPSTPYLHNTFVDYTGTTVRGVQVYIDAVNNHTFEVVLFVVKSLWVTFTT